MKLTIGDVLKLDIMKTASIRTGEEHVNERYVQWISVIETPVENFVRQNELVLSTAIGSGHDLILFKKFVEDIIESEASALLVALGRHIFDIPKEVLDLAEAHDFILIEIPWEVRFGNIIEEVMRELNNRQQKDRERSEKIQQELLKLILQEKGLKQILHFIEKQVGYPLVITDRGGIIHEHYNHSHRLIKSWNDYVIEGVIPVKEGTSLLPHDPMLHKFQLIKLEGYTALQLPVFQVSGDIQGYLYLLLPPQVPVDSFLTNYIVTVLEHSTTTIALWLSRKNAIEKTEMRLRSDFVLELAKGNIHSWNQANSRAKLLGYNLRLPYFCILGYPENLQNLYEKIKREEGSFKQWIESMIRYIEEEIYYAAQSLKREIMMTYEEDQLLIFIETLPGQTNENPAAFLDLVERRLRNLLPDVVLSWGIGNYHEDLNGFKKSYENAKLALTIGQRKNGAGNRTLYEQTHIDRILLAIAQNEEMKEVILSTIKPLVLYDQQRNMDLIGTLNSYHQCHGNVSQTARFLNLHRQSLLYRLRKIESLTGLSLVDPDDLFLLDLSIRIWKMGHYEGSRIDT
ncbi:purine catabolism regulatory protein [Mesobacillus persicus]|uniref:Purine catabolism regulatory protein n=1 Tax=Mesobacillus persicus TaxID=930146 RepID=A0A1H7VPD9_9BACI|nr:PucR family transcriptional regulator [Mesobacillus persicus]SEM10695.1 purine catabolism regulatory protein [Mesobacillus persicus]